MRQLIIVRKDLQMSPGKAAAQVAHAAMAFIARRLSLTNDGVNTEANEVKAVFDTTFDVWRDWFQDDYTKTICEAKSRNHLLRAVTIAEERGLSEGRDFFLIYDVCRTELTPEEVGEDGRGRTLTCIGFRPLSDDVAHSISKKFQLYR